MPSDMREAVARAMFEHEEPPGSWEYASPSGREWWLTYANAALAVIRERLAEKVPEATYTPEQPAMVPYEKPLFIHTWNACRAAMLRELGGEG